MSCYCPALGENPCPLTNVQCEVRKRKYRAKLKELKRSGLSEREAAQRIIEYMTKELEEAHG